jgi:polyhydroxyalkanoate synthesis repressor PhaR
MVRLIKRYGGGSRKLYDTEESRYVGLDEIARFIRRGQELQVVDSGTGEDVTAPTLAQVILEGERRGFSFLTAEFLHEAVRRGGRALTRRVEALQSGVDRLVQSGVERLPAVRAMRGEMRQLREGLASLERSMRALEVGTPSRRSPGNGRRGKGRGRRRPR